jgi:hypothetical protein
MRLASIIYGDPLIMAIEWALIFAVGYIAIRRNGGKS